MHEAEPRFEELCGAWQLVSLDAIKPDGEATTGWLGAKPTGLLVYDRSGCMSVQIMSGPRDFLVAGETQAPQSGYYAYFGAFEVDETARTIVHRVRGSLRPDEIGVDYTQDAALSQNQLILLTARHLVDGEERRNRIVWQRVKTGDL